MSEDRITPKAFFLDALPMMLVIQQAVYWTAVALDGQPPPQHAYAVSALVLALAGGLLLLRPSSASNTNRTVE